MDEAYAGLYIYLARGSGKWIATKRFLNQLQLYSALYSNPEIGKYFHPWCEAFYPGVLKLEPGFDYIYLRGE